MAGWIVEGKRGPLLVGTVVSYRIGDKVHRETGHGRSYIQNLPGRKVITCHPVVSYTTRKV
jgi:hypothetical protein